MKKRCEDIFIFSLSAYGVNDLSHLDVLIIFETINVLMVIDASCLFVASVPFWFLAGKHALENSLIVYSVPL